MRTSSIVARRRGSASSGSPHAAHGPGETLLARTDVPAARAAASERAGPEAPATGQAAALRMLRDAMAVGRDAASFHQAVRDLTRLLAASGGVPRSRSAATRMDVSMQIIDAVGGGTARRRG